MNNVKNVVLGVVLLTIFFGLIYLQTEIQNLKSQQTSTIPTTSKSSNSEPKGTVSTSNLSPTPTPAFATVQSTTIIANIIATPTFVSPNTSAGQVLIINGTVTNQGPNTEYNVGLNVTAFGSFSLLPSQEVIDMTVPINSGTYAMGTDYSLSTLTPNEVIPVTITIIPKLSSQEPMLSNVNVTVSWSNKP
jgi:hypothetical protein